MKNQTPLPTALSFILLMMISGPLFSQDTLVLVKADSTKKNKHYFELSLGQTLLFVSDSKLQDIQTEEAVIVPTNAKLFFAELRPDKKFRIPVFFNLPTESRQYIINGELVSKRASPTFGVGLQYRAFRLTIGKKSAIEFEAGPLASLLIDQNKSLRFAPIVAGRFRFVRNEDMVLYIGSSYSLGINAFGMLFGIGYVF
ncbi:MAG: hypothetical protein A3D31_15550 [Candidatus Fluviicola riflensis]|nr:MAG: hypothetical protein CHH17_00485 [Candidatus Fluviicola riflensis]OGS78374.1 MAG: hypothetical protein A3D31_15550 [Candidatus Fluviicola riflensis]OGS85440.1 MAG: hypothetical protein A2724_12485 [Fluviicola sp. RIFCSPHIGHO2_01_FULL_43_53]OGS87482.1 MAG: hypothetical protein A3E30_08905 [Fluviicola sp. RIFCSPHIGHO2_12_FULL_43_24]